MHQPVFGIYYDITSTESTTTKGTFHVRIAGITHIAFR